MQAMFSLPHFVFNIIENFTNALKKHRNFDIHKEINIL